MTEDETSTSTAAAELKPPPNVLLAGIVGSHAYGLARAGSDVDRLGCYAAPTTAFHGLRPPGAQDSTWVSKNPDANYHEAGKLAALLLASNPAATEILWLDEYEVLTPEGTALIAIRSCLLSAEAVRSAYLRNAERQFRRIRNHDRDGSAAGNRERAAKLARHMWRLIRQGANLYRTGHLTVRLTPDDVAACRMFGEQVAAGDLECARRVLGCAEAEFGRPGVLPDHPDEAAAEAWLQDVRLAYWDRA